eukprot:1854319-Prorocentrum_lima.AAC.1
MASIRETFENSLRNCIPLRFIMSTYELMEYDDPRRSYQYLEQQVIKFLDQRRLNRNRVELENSVRQGGNGYSQKAATPAPKKNYQNTDDIPAAPAPKRARRPRSSKPPQHEVDRGNAAPG